RTTHAPRAPIGRTSRQAHAPALRSPRPGPSSRGLQITDSPDYRVGGSTATSLSPDYLSSERIVYSHSMVPGGFDVMSNTTRFTPSTSLTIRLLMRASTRAGTRARSAAIAASLVTTRPATPFAYVGQRPITPAASAGV